ncbi:tyrosine-protein phosphatase [Cecembia lonarensis]|nr:tyrosine-protein phosphatase [Cecembia lonarensis]
MMKIIKALLKALLLVFIAGNLQAQINIGITASPNFRELGGIEINDGKTIREGLIFRSGSFSNLSDLDAQKLKATGLNTIIDFRSDFEIEREPDFIPESMSVNWIHAPIGSLDQSGMGKFMQVLTKEDFQQEDVDQLMIEANLGFVEYIQDFKPLFDLIQEEDAVVLFHCSAGKDRTGLASALFLHALGADWDTIMEDFLRSNEAVEKTDLSKMAMYGIPEDRAKALMGVKAVYLESAWSAIEEKYGSADALLAQEFGIGQEEKEFLRSKYLEKRD